MTLRLPHRALVPVIALAVLAGVVSTFMLGQLPPPASEEAPSVVRPKLAPRAPVKKPVGARTRKLVTASAPRVKRPIAKPAASPAAKRATKPGATPAAKAAPVPVAKPTPVPVAKAAPVPVRKPVERPAADPVGRGGLPIVLSRALAKNGVAVVALYDPRAGIDELAVAEARAGAAGANAGFVAINVFSERQSRPLANLLGVLENPSVLIYRRPDSLFVRIDGFADRETVAQAAANARR